MSDRDRMLAEGPRVAPEPRTVETSEAHGRLVVRAPDVSSRRRSPAWAGRLAAPAVVAVVVLLQVVGAGGYAELLFVGAFVVLGLLKVLAGGGEN